MSFFNPIEIEDHGKMGGPVIAIRKIKDLARGSAFWITSLRGTIWSMKIRSKMGINKIPFNQSVELQTVVLRRWIQSVSGKSPAKADGRPIRRGLLTSSIPRKREPRVARGGKPSAGIGNICPRSASAVVKAAAAVVPDCSNNSKFCFFRFQILEPRTRVPTSRSAF